MSIISCFPDNADCPYVSGDGIEINQKGGRSEIRVVTPVKSIVTSDEWNAIDEAEKATGLYIIDDGFDGGSGSIGVSVQVDDTMVSKDGVIGVKSPVQGIVTEEEWNALDESAKATGFFVVDDGADSGGGSSENVYSTVETRIGTWTNGKPLYRVVINATTPSSSNSSSSIEIAKYSADVEDVARCNGVLTTKTGQKIQVPFYCATDEFVFIGYNPSTYSVDDLRNTLRMIVGQKCVSRPVSVILEYTKTTDTAQEVKT